MPFIDQHVYVVFGTIETKGEKEGKRRNGEEIRNFSGLTHWN